MDVCGLDSEGNRIKSAKDMWIQELGLENNNSTNKRHEWYSKGISYWQGVEASVDGVLGGYGHVNDVDVKGSDGFLKPLLNARFGAERRHLAALDCGSGIGRVTKNLLLRHFNEVDLVEPVSHFLDAAREKLSHNGDVDVDAHRAVNFYCIPLQDFTPEAGRYDVIWIQWCIGHLTDDDFISFFKRAKVGLKPNGFFVVKENVARNEALTCVMRSLLDDRNNLYCPVSTATQFHGATVLYSMLIGFVLDKEDRSVTRSDSYFQELFYQCGLFLYSTKDQKGFPGEIFPVKMYALVTSKPKGANGGKFKKQRYTPAIIKS